MKILRGLFLTVFYLFVYLICARMIAIHIAGFFERKLAFLHQKKTPERLKNNPSTTLFIGHLNCRGNQL